MRGTWSRYKAVASYVALVRLDHGKVTFLVILVRLFELTLFKIGVGFGAIVSDMNDTAFGNRRCRVAFKP